MDSFKRIKEMRDFPAPHPILPWEWALGPLRYHPDSPLSLIEERWEALLQDICTTEQTYRTFIAQHPYFFLVQCVDTHFVLTEIRLGSDYVVDFVVPEQLASRGVFYRFIELESPHNPPFNKRGDPSARLSHALQQIADWKRWLRTNNQLASDLFPCFSMVSVSFAIYIGTRSNSKQWLSKRNTFSEEYGIEIRSFDSLTDRIRDPVLTLSDTLTCSSQEYNVPLELVNALRNPFYTAYSDRVWRKVRRELAHVDHFVEWNADVLLKHRSYDKRLVRQFIECCCSNQQEVDDVVAQYRERRRRRTS